MDRIEDRIKDDISLWRGVLGSVGGSCPCDASTDDKKPLELILDGICRSSDPLCKGRPLS